MPTMTPAWLRAASTSEASPRASFNPFPFRNGFFRFARIRNYSLSQLALTQGILAGVIYVGAPYVKDEFQTQIGALRRRREPLKVH
jgi:hypothetical protein